MSQRREPPRVRRALIVEAARQVLIRDGLHRTGLRDIAAEAEVSVGTITYHFRSINEILVEAAVREVDRFYTPLLEAVRLEPDPARALMLLIDPLFDGTEAAAGHWRLWSDYWTAIARDPGMAAEDYGRLRLWQQCFEQTVARGITEEVFSAAAVPAEVALKTAAYSDGIATQLSMGAGGLDHHAARRWLRRFLGVELGITFEECRGG